MGLYHLSTVSIMCLNTAVKTETLELLGSQPFSATFQFETLRQVTKLLYDHSVVCKIWMNSSYLIGLFYKLNEIIRVSGSCFPSDLCSCTSLPCSIPPNHINFLVGQTYQACSHLRAFACAVPSTGITLFPDSYAFLPQVLAQKSPPWSHLSPRLVSSRRALTPVSFAALSPAPDTFSECV